MSRRRRTAIQTFSLSFLDVICCGFGAVILLFILTTGQRAAHLSDAASEYEAATRAVGDAVEQATGRLGDLRGEEERLEERNAAATARLRQRHSDLAALLEALQRLEDQSTATAALVTTLEEQVADQPEPDPEPDPPPLRVPGTALRQYFTEFRLDGRHTAILIEGSGGMIADTLAESMAIATRSESARREGPKWRRAVAATRWILANLQEPEYFQTFLFSTDAEPLAPADGGGWARLNDRSAVQAAVDGVSAWTPRGGANFEKAFDALARLDPPPDNIILVIDGLPTQGRRAPPGVEVDEPTRRRMLNDAMARLPPNVPVNVILFPNDGDPNAALEWWRVAIRTNGSFICPAPDWPRVN